MKTIKRILVIVLVFSLDANSTIQTSRSTILFPMPPNQISTAPSFTTTQLVIDAADEKAAFIFRVTKTGTVDKILWGTRVVTTGGNVDVRLETVDAATGDPTGTLYATNTNVAVGVASTDDNTTFVSTMTATASVTIGDLVAVVISNPGAAFGNMQISAWAESGSAFPYSDLYTGTWAKVAITPVVSLGYNDGTKMPAVGTLPANGAPTNTFNNTSNPNHYALMLNFPFPTRVSGWWAYGDFDGDFDVILTSAAWGGGAGLLSYSYDKDIEAVTAGGLAIVPFSSTFDLAANTDYRLVLKPTSATNLSLYSATVVSSMTLASMEGGFNVRLSTASNPTQNSSWSQSNTERPFLGVILDSFDDAVSSGGGTKGFTFSQ